MVIMIEESWRELEDEWNEVEYIQRELDIERKEAKDDALAQEMEEIDQKYLRWAI